MVKQLTTVIGLTDNGVRDWWLQRVSAVIIATYFIVLSCFFLLHAHIHYRLLHSFFATTWMQVFTVIALISLFLHAWIGIWTVITDYVNAIALRLLIQLLVILTLTTYLVWGIIALCKLTS